MSHTRFRPAAARAVCAAVLTFLSCLALPAYAGDYAERVILGFSPDGGTFAFEQFGVQDGSGFPYADIFVIDTNSDSWVKGSPFRVMMKDERSELKWARREVLTRAGNLLKQRLITKPGRILASNPPFELSANPHRVEVNAALPLTASPERWTFTLEAFPLADERCKSFGADTVGFRLTAAAAGMPARVLHLDNAIPDSRGCPLSYGISDVVAYWPEGGSRTFAVLVSVFTLGFEGPDRRFLAVTTRAP